MHYQYVYAHFCVFDPCDYPENESLSQQARSNSIQNFKYGFDDIFLTVLIERMEDNQDIFTKIIDDPEFGDAVKAWMLKKVYDRLKEKPQAS